MRKRLLICCFGLCAGVFAQDASAQQQSLAELEKRAFQQLESGKTDPTALAETILTQAGNRPSIYVINANTILGIVHKNKGHYVSALEYYLDALTVSEKLKDNGRISASLNNIGIIYVLQENYKKAIDYFNRSLQLEEDLKQPLQKSIRLFNLGDCYKELKQYDEALGYYTNSLLIEKRLKNPIGIIYAQLGIAEVYIHTDRLTDAQTTLVGVATLLQDADQEAEVLYYKLKGEEAIESNQLSEAERWLKKAIDFSQKHDLKNELLDIYLLLSKLYESNNQPQLAVVHYRKYIELNNELQSNFVKNQLEDLTYQNKLNRKQLEITLLQKEKDLAKENARAMQQLRQYDWRIMIFSVLSMLFVIAVVFLGVRRLTTPR